MTRTYELAIVTDPRQTDEEVEALVERQRELIEATEGSSVTHVESWGQRKLAYPINKLNEGKYVFLFVSAEGSAPTWPDIERLLQQNEKVLRHLVVRTDEDIKRAMRKGKVKPKVPGQTEENEPEGEREHAT